MTSQQTRSGIAYMVGGGILLGTLGVPLEEAGQHSIAAVWFRCLFGGIALSIVLAVSGRLAELKLGGRSLIVVIVVSLLMLFMWWLFFEAILRTSIALATLIFHLQPFIVMALGAWWLGDKVSPLQWAAVGVAVIGLALVSDAASALVGIKHLEYDEWIGLMMCLGGAFCYALVVVLTKFVQTSGATTSNGDRVPAMSPPSPLVLVWWQCAIGTLLFSWWPIQYGLPAAPAAWAWLLALGVLNTGLAYSLLYAGISKLSSGRIALLQFAYPLTAVIVDGTVYGRVLDNLQIFGFVLMAVSLFVAVSFGDKNRR